MTMLRSSSAINPPKPPGPAINDITNCIWITAGLFWSNWNSIDHVSTE